MLPRCKRRCTLAGLIREEPAGSSAITTAAQNAAASGSTYGPHNATMICPWCGARHMSPYKSEDVEEGDDE